MIITFNVGGGLIDVKVDSDRRLFCRGPLTNDKWLLFRDMVERSGQDGSAAEITERRLSCRYCLPDDKSVEFYVIDEFLRSPALMRVGISHVGTRW